MVRTKMAGAGVRYMYTTIAIRGSEKISQIWDFSPAN